VEPEPGVDDLENGKLLTLTGLELRLLGCSARSQSLSLLTIRMGWKLIVSNKQKDVEEAVCNIFQGTVSEFVWRE
jgi:hypothetical protein